MQMTQNLISPWDEMIPFHSYWCVTKFKIVQEMSRLSLHLLNFITQTLISLLNETSWTCCRVSEQSAWRVLLWGQVAACIVTGSIGFRCSQWSQVNGHAYQSHNPPTDEQTRRDLTDQSRRTSNRGVIFTKPWSSRHWKHCRAWQCSLWSWSQSFVWLWLCVNLLFLTQFGPYFVFKLIFDLISRAATEIWVSLEIGVHAKLLPLPSQRPTHPEFIPLHLPGVAYQDAG